MEFQEWFCLKARETFSIDPKVYPNDAKFYFGRGREKERILSQLRRGFQDPGVAKMLLYGPYGSGKTQTLFFIDYILRTNKPSTCKFTPYIVHLDLEMRSKSDFRDWHIQLMESLGKEKVTKWLEKLSSIGAGFDDELGDIFRNERNMVEIAKKLLMGGDISFTAWKWYCGVKLSARELETLRVTRNLGDIGVGDVVNLLSSLGRLAEKNEEKLIFLMDEAEQFRNVTAGDSTRDLHDFLRKISEKSNSATGFLIAFEAVTLDDMPGWFYEEDILRRVGRDNIIEVSHLPAVKDVQSFMKEMLGEFIDKEQADKRIKEKGLEVSLETYPFKADAFDLLADYAIQDPSRALPSNIIRTINECAITAWDKELPIIDADILNEIAPLIFG